MANYYFRGRGKDGKLIKGIRKAQSSDQLVSELQAENIIPVSIKLNTKTVRKPLQWSLSITRSVSNDDLQILCRQLYTLAKAGIPVAMAMQRLAETTRHPSLQNALNKIYQLLNQGRDLTYSLSQFPEIFSPFIVNMVKVGESTGKLDLAFLQLSDYLNLDIETKKKIKAAIRYPIIVIIATLVALLVINVFVVPSFTKLFARADTALPLATKILIASSNLILGYWHVLLLVVVISVVSARYYLKTPLGQQSWGRWQLKIPLIGWILHRIALGRFARLFSLSLRAGVSAYDAIEMVGSAVGNAYIELKVKEISQLIARGNTIASSVQKTQLFSPLVIQMITLGEETGQIDTLLDDVADFYEREVDYDMVRLGDAIEPILLVVMAIMVLILALGVFLPMWDLASVVR